MGQQWHCRWNRYHQDSDGRPQDFESYPPPGKALAAPQYQSLRQCGYPHMDLTGGG